MPLIWTREKIAERTTEEIKTIRGNALNKGVNDLVALCDTELSKRTPTKIQSGAKRTNSVQNNGLVVGYHFVCRPKEKGVTRNIDGTVWSGTWVVAASRAEKSLKAGAYVALHLSHEDPSYLKGNIKGMRRSKRARQYADGQEVKIPEGTDFLLELTDDTIEWRGDGTVERSYVYTLDPEAQADGS